MPEILILGGRNSALPECQACKTGGIDGESCYQNARMRGRALGCMECHVHSCSYGKDLEYLLLL